MRWLDRFRRKAPDAKAQIAARVVQDVTVRVPVKAPYYHEIILAPDGGPWHARIYRRDGGEKVADIEGVGDRQAAYEAVLTWYKEHTS